MTKRTVIIEGPDGAGKSTLIRDLARDLDRAVIHTGGPKDNKILMDAIVEKIHFNKASAIFDRVPFISDPIYSAVTGRNTLLNSSEIHKNLELLNPIIIYCRRSKISDMFKAIDQGKKEHKSGEHLREVLEQYFKIVSLYDASMLELSKSYKVIKYDWASDNYQRLWEKVSCAV